MLDITWSNNPNWTDPEAGLLPHNGYGYATERILDTLKDLGYSVSANNAKADVQIWFDQPQHWEFYDDVYKIGYHPWESTQLKPGWAEKMNACDEVWTPSPLIADWYRRYAGITVPVYVFEHGVDKVWEPKKRTWEDSTFQILHVGADAVRRASKDAMQSVRLAFPRDMDVQLNMKMISSGWNIGALPRVNIMNYKMDIDSMVELYHNNHVMLGLSYGEGFGLTPLQALATGMPVIGQPDWAPYSEFLDENLSVSSSLVRSPWPAVHPGMMLKPNQNEIMDRLRYVYNNYDEVAERAFTQAEAVRSKYDWNTLTKDAFEDLEKRLKKV